MLIDDYDICDVIHSNVNSMRDKTIEPIPSSTFVYVSSKIKSHIWYEILGVGVGRDDENSEAIRRDLC